MSGSCETQDRGKLLLYYPSFLKHSFKTQADSPHLTYKAFGLMMVSPFGDCNLKSVFLRMDLKLPLAQSPCRISE